MWNGPSPVPVCTSCESEEYYLIARGEDGVMGPVCIPGIRLDDIRLADDHVFGLHYSPFRYRARVTTSNTAAPGPASSLARLYSRSSLLSTTDSVSDSTSLPLSTQL